MKSPSFLVCTFPSFACRDNFLSSLLSFQSSSNIYETTFAILILWSLTLPQTAMNVLPWGLLQGMMSPSQDIDDNPRLYLTRNVNTIGRDPAKSEHVLSYVYISGLHCKIKLDDSESLENPIVTLYDVR